MEAFERGASTPGGVSEQRYEISYRNWVWLRYTDAQNDPRTRRILPVLRALTAAAPARDYNDRDPRP